MLIACLLFSQSFCYLLVKTKTKMETLQESTVTPAPSATSPTGIFGTKIPSTAAFLLAIILFLLPFAEVRCNGSAVANNTGLGIAIGSEWKELVTKNLFGAPLDNNTDDKKEYNQKHDPNIFAIAALTFGIIGFLIAVLNFKGGSKINLFVGILGVVSLIAMLIDLKSKVKSDTSAKSSDFGFNMSMNVTIDGTGWCYLTMILFIIGAIFSWQRSKATATR
jgi:hypothetical protein